MNLFKFVQIIFFFFSYWNNNRWNLLQANQTFFVHPLDGEVFANVVNMSTGFHVSLD